MTLTLPNLYCSPNDVIDLMGVDAVDARLDDQNKASGQEVQVTQDAALSAASLQVTALQYPLLRGTVLRFAGGATENVVAVTLTATATTGDQTLAVSPLTEAVYENATAPDSGVNLAFAARLAKACRYGTSQVKDYCCGRYNDSDLANNASEGGSVSRWATALAARWLCRRLGRTLPQAVKEEAEESQEELRAVKVGALNIADIGTRSAGWPFISNQTVDIRYGTAKVRVEPIISEATPTQYGQFVDWNSVFSLDGFW